jgi:hypothetical protein
VTCIFTIVNVGAAAATGTLALNTTLTIPTAEGVSVGIISTVFDCPGDVIILPVTVITTTVSAENYASCGGATLLPGEQATVVLTYDAVGTASVGTPLTFTATVDPGNAIAEINEGNNTYGRVIRTR